MRTMAGIDTAVQAAQWYENLRAQSNPKFMPLFADEHRFLVLKGGGGSGKSIFAGRKVIERCLAEPGHRFLVLRKVGRTLRESCWRQLLGQCGDICPGEFTANRTDMSISFSNGSIILFSGLDDPEKLKSIYNITSIWIEEASELQEADFNQLDIRLRGQTKYYKQFIITFNPISITHWLKKRFFDATDERTRVHESTYRDNRFLTPEDIEVLENFGKVDEYYYQVYCLGQWGVTGKTVFDGRALTERLMSLAKPAKVGRFEYDYDGAKILSWQWVDDASGNIKVYAAPESGVPYVIGGDTAGDGSDSFVGQVLDNRTGHQAAILRQSMDEDEYARQMYCLGMWYNTALVGIETNFSTFPVRELERLGYPNQYVRETVDDYTHKVMQKYGFVTNTKTRPVIIAGLVQAVRDDVACVSDRTTIEEMLTFVRSDSWKPEAEDGAHDDTVMALAIAHYIRPQQKYTAKDAVQKRKWTSDMWEDYRNADRETRKLLIDKWGEPLR